MKKGRIILGAVTLILAVSSTLAFKSNGNKKFSLATLFTKSDGTGQIDCKRGTGTACPTNLTTLYTAAGTAVNGPFKAVAH